MNATAVFSLTYFLGCVTKASVVAPFLTVAAIMYLAELKSEDEHRDTGLQEERDLDNSACDNAF